MNPSQNPVGRKHDERATKGVGAGLTSQSAAGIGLPPANLADGIMPLQVILVDYEAMDEQPERWDGMG